jgi:hypothetical protein
LLKKLALTTIDALSPRTLGSRNNMLLHGVQIAAKPALGSAFAVNPMN